MGYPNPLERWLVQWVWVSPLWVKGFFVPTKNKCCLILDEVRAVVKFCQILKSICRKEGLQDFVWRCFMEPQVWGSTLKSWWEGLKTREVKQSQPLALFRNAARLPVSYCLNTGSDGRDSLWFVGWTQTLPRPPSQGPVSELREQWKNHWYTPWHWDPEGCWHMTTLDERVKLCLDT